MRVCSFLFIAMQLLGKACSFSIKRLTSSQKLIGSEQESKKEIASFETQFITPEFQSLNRRALITSVIASCAVLPKSPVALAEDSSEAPQKERFTSAEVARLLSPIPTFTIVDKTGTPYMVVGEDAKMSAYFFTSFGEAERVLNLAKKSASRGLKELQTEKNGERKAAGQKPLTKEEIEVEVGLNPWESARISSVPLDFAVTLSNRGKLKGAYFRVAPREEDIDDALVVDKSDDLEEGKVPLFYFDDLELESGKENWSGSNKEMPLFFQKGQLLNEWKRRNPKKDIPEIKTTELFSLLTTLVQATSNSDADLEKLVIIAPKDSENKAALCEKRGGIEKPFKLGERILVL
mmetsp:Transcript_14125/g.20568  ORF Transcript_14125/g.20568 Transcript_14125/m.20568 type:complete len:349 (-) Transcript_14125:185-1231(-)